MQQVQKLSALSVISLMLSDTFKQIIAHWVHWGL